MKEITNFKDVPLNKKCPFTKSVLSIHGKKKSIVVTTKASELADTETGEAFNGKTLKTIYKEYDAEKFIKVYLDNLKMMFGLSRTALNVLTLVFSKMRPNTTEVFFTIDEVQDYCSYKHYKSAHDGIIELINKNIIARGYMKVNYFINPAFAFNGDRLRIVKEYQLPQMKMEGDIVEGQKILLINKLT